MALEAGYQVILKGSGGTEATQLIAGRADQRSETYLLLKSATSITR